MSNIRVFYDTLREHLPDALQKNSQVEGINTLLSEAQKYQMSAQELAYVFATAYWETAKTFQPVEEAFWKDDAWRKRNLRYYPWHGRGYVQLTWKENYEKAQKELGVAFTEDPTLAMVPEYAAKILFTGMRDGWFTNRKLSDYIDKEDESDSEDVKEYINARRIVNGKDRAKEIARVAIAFEKAFVAAQPDDRTSNSANMWSVISDIIREYEEGQK